MLSKIFDFCVSMGKWYADCRKEADAEIANEPRNTFEEGGNQWYPRWFSLLTATTAGLLAVLV